VSSLLVSSVIMRLSIGSGTLIMLFVITSSMQSLYIMSGLPFLFTIGVTTLSFLFTIGVKTEL